MGIDKDRVCEITKRFREFHIGVIGDLILDQYIWGNATRISPEAPVPVVKVERKTSTLGGAANVLRNISSLGAKSVAFGVVGKDRAGEEIVNLCRKWNIEPTGIVVDSERNTTVKTRLIADHQQVARIDEEKDCRISNKLAKTLFDDVSSCIKENRLDAIIIEDYNKGVISNFLLEELQTLLNSKNIPMALDPHPQNPFDLKNIKLLTPNRTEAFSMANEPYTSTVLPLENDYKLNAVGNKLINKWSPEVLLITLGSAGMALFEAAAKPIQIPTAAKEVFDVSGAGDTVIATFTTALLSGASSLEAATIANHAAGIVVRKVGTVPVDVDDLLDSFSPH